MKKSEYHYFRLQKGYIIGFYYPPVVYVGKDGLLYCIYEYKEEIDVFTTPEEIIADQLSNICR